MKKREMAGTIMHSAKCYWIAALLLISVIGSHAIAGEASKDGDLILKGEFTATISEHQSIPGPDPDSKEAPLGLIRSYLHQRSQ
jgi:hypothetical protein